MKNYYEILELNKKASKEVIEKAYKTLAKKYHPDRYTGTKKEYAEKKLKEINEAYEILSDEFLKEQYDTQLQKEEMKYYSEIYRQKEGNEKQKKETKELNEKMKKHKVGSFVGLIELTKELFKNKPKRDEIKEITKKDIVAIILTIIIIILIGIALWYIPFTNGWMRELLLENPIFNWIAGIFKSK